MPGDEYTFYNQHKRGTHEYFQFREDMFGMLHNLRHRVEYDQDGLTHFVILGWG